MSAWMTSFMMATHLEMLEGSIGDDQRIAGRAMGATARRILDILQGKEPEETTNDQ